jgi:hypothetical protein
MPGADEMTFEDLLCDACLHLMETSTDGVLLADFCERCRKRIFGLAIEVPAEAFEAPKDKE